MNKILYYIKLSLSHAIGYWQKYSSIEHYYTNPRIGHQN